MSLFSLSIASLLVQCQSQLRTLYLEGIKGCHMEFAAYNLLCVLLHSSNNRDLLSAMSRFASICTLAFFSFFFFFFLLFLMIYLLNPNSFQNQLIILMIARALSNPVASFSHLFLSLLAVCEISCCHTYGFLLQFFLIYFTISSLSMLQ